MSNSRPNFPSSRSRRDAWRKRSASRRCPPTPRPRLQTDRRAAPRGRGPLQPAVGGRGRAPHDQPALGWHRQDAHDQDALAALWTTGRTPMRGTRRGTSAARSAPCSGPKAFDGRTYRAYGRHPPDSRKAATPGSARGISLTEASTLVPVMLRPHSALIPGGSSYRRLTDILWPVPGTLPPQLLKKRRIPGRGPVRPVRLFRAGCPPGSGPHGPA